MKTEFKSSFARDLRKIRDKETLEKIQRLISLVEQVESLESVPGVKRLQSEAPYYRIRLGDYRVGISIIGTTITFIHFLHRNEIYRYFP